MKDKIVVSTATVCKIKVIVDTVTKKIKLINRISDEPGFIGTTDDVKEPTVGFPVCFFMEGAEKEINKRVKKIMRKSKLLSIIGR